MTDPSKKVYSSIHEALLDYARWGKKTRLGKKTYDEMDAEKAKEELDKTGITYLNDVLIVEEF
jgi:hypothetical protein